MHARSTSDRSRRLVGIWLLLVAVLVAVMAVIGAVTRLTESGLSIVEWRPVVGVLPPLSAEEWQHHYNLYRATPEYRLVNAGFGLAGFKQIFWWEWIHRTFGHVLGLIFILPLLWFWARGAIDAAQARRLLLILALGGLQAVVGGLMVQSGLIDRPAVSHFKLAAHLGIATLIFALLCWAAISMLERPGSRARTALLQIHGWIGLGLLALTMLWGAFVAGLDAGKIYNSFPLMDGRWLPAEAGRLLPWWRNPLEDMATVQFLHRWLGTATMLVLLAYGARLLAGEGRTPLNLTLLALAIVQPALGVAALLLGVPVWLGALHQLGALLLLATLLWVQWRGIAPAAPRTS